MSGDELFLGLDLGTTAIKGGLFDREGRLIAHARRRYPTMRPEPQFVEQDPRDWTDGLVAVMDELLETPEAGRIAGVGLCSQVNTDVFVDAAGAPLAPAIAWQDNRAAAEAAELDAAVSPEDRLAWWGVPLPIGASHVLARMMWMARRRPDIFAECRYVFTPKDYCLRALSGVVATDPMSSFFVVGRDLTYVEPLIRRVEGAAERLPPLRFFTDVVGEIALGSSGRRAPVVAGTMDAWSGVFGSGIHATGMGAYISGTSEILALATRERAGAPGIVTFPAAAGLNLLAGPTQSGGDALRWWGEANGRDVEDVIRLAEQASRAGSQILFLPHLEGERAPLWDASLRAAFLGIDGRAKAPELALAVMEGVALSARMLFRAIESAGESVPRLFHAGGGAASDLWAQIRADCLGVPLDRVACLDVGCLGAAIMASVGVGAHASLSGAILAMTRVDRTFFPDPGRRARYDAMFERYAQAIAALKPIAQTV